MRLSFVGLLLVASGFASAEYLAYAVAEGGRSPLPERLDKIDAKHLLNVEWGEFAGKKTRVGVLEVDNNSATSSFKVTDSTGATYESEWNLSGGTVPVNGIEAIVTDSGSLNGLRSVTYSESRIWQHLAVSRNRQRRPQEKYLAPKY